MIIPLMQHDAVDTYHWVTDGQSLNAVAPGQGHPRPRRPNRRSRRLRRSRHRRRAARRLVAFAPSFSAILIGAERFDRLRANQTVRAFLNGAGPAAIGAIAGAAIPLALTETWQLVVLAAAAIALFVLRRGVVLTLIAAGGAGALATALGAPLPS